MTTQTTTPTPDAWWEEALFAVSMTAVVGGLATLEYQAGSHAGWPWWQALGVPLAIDAFAVKTLIDRSTRWWDVAFALALLLSAVALSVFRPPAAWTAAGLGAVLVAVLWRHEDQRRRRRVTTDTVAELGELLRGARQEVATVRRELATVKAAAEATVADAVASERRRLDREATEDRRQSAANGGEPVAKTSPPVADPPPVNGSRDEQVEWVRRLIAYSPDTTWRQVAEHLQLEPRAAQHRVTHARRLHSVGAAS